ncbi:hypothetical protein, partial [Vibrio parahaemolyticus]
EVVVLYNLLGIGEISGVMTSNFDFDYFTIFQILVVVLVLIQGTMIPFYEYSSLNKFKSAFGLLKRIAPYGSIFLVLVFYPFVDSKISTIVHESASFFPYARYYVVSLYLAASVLLAISVYLAAVLVFLVVQSLVRFHAYTKGAEKIRNYIGFIRMLSYCVVIVGATYMSGLVSSLFLFSPYNDIYIEKIIVFTSYSPNTACLNKNGELFVNPINYLDQQRVSILTLSEKGYNNQFKIEKCVRN